jgi:hypothetical protein
MVGFEFEERSFDCAPRPRTAAEKKRRAGFAQSLSG